jgi:hypothetical protein
MCGSQPGNSGGTKILKNKAKKQRLLPFDFVW